MKKNLIYALMSAIALTGAVGLSSCTDEEMAEVNPGYNPETGEVPVNFVFNVAVGNTPTTRMSATNTQANATTTYNSEQANPFRGIGDVQLLSYKLTSDGSFVSTATTADKIYSLGTIIGKGGIDARTGAEGTPKSRRVIELSLPSGTNALMFWGKAIKDGTDFQQGKIDWYVDKDISQNAFSLVHIVADDTDASITTKDAHGQTALGQYRQLVATVLTKIIQSGLNVNATYTGAEGTKSYAGTLRWSDYVNVAISTSAGGVKTVTSITPKVKDPADANEDLCPLGQILASSFVTLNTIHTDELRAGSGPDVARTMGDLYNAISSVANAEPTSILEAVAKQVGQSVAYNIEQAFSNPLSSCSWKSSTTPELNSVKAFADLMTATKDSEGTTVYSDDQVPLVTENLQNFPTNFNLPLGSVILEVCVDNNDRVAYKYSGTVPTYAMGGTAGSAQSNFDPKNYVYPAELCYFGNSPVRVTDDDHLTSQYPDGVDNWNNDNSWVAGATGEGKKAWTTTHVLSTTRSVAMKNNINYGTALLKTTVRYGAATLEDNNAYIQSQRSSATEDNAKFDVTKPGQFTLTGVLVGGQEQTVGWNYLAKEGTGAGFEYMIYDKDLPSTAIPLYNGQPATPAQGETPAVEEVASAMSQPNYTLVWDNWDENKKGSKQRDVYIALEFVNNTGKDFWGLNNLIRNGGTFYITGKLDPDAGLSTADRSEGITWPTDFPLPPYANGSTLKERRVFIQDYITEANFVLGPSSLQHALVSVPDLRSTQISLGLSVDLVWRKGLTYDKVILGE